MPQQCNYCGAGELPKGGAYGKMDGQARTGYQKHHIPANSVSPLSRYKGGAIQISPSDHAKTGSFGNTKAAKAYRAKQNAYIEAGDFKSAFEMDVIDIKSKFGNKYDNAIKEARNYYMKMGMFK